MNVAGIWYQTEMILFNEAEHMVGSNKWIFNNKTCGILTPTPRKYQCEIKGDSIYIKSLKNYSYQEWEENLLFGRYHYTVSDSFMTLKKLDTLQINFKRHLK